MQRVSRGLSDVDNKKKRHEQRGKSSKAAAATTAAAVEGSACACGHPI